MRHNRHRLFTLFIVNFTIFLYILYTTREKILRNKINHSAYRRRKKIIKKCNKQSKQLPIISKTRLFYFLRNYGDQYIKNCGILPQFLYQINNIEQKIITYTAQLPSRLHGGNTDGQPHDGEAVFPGLIIANLTQEGLRIEVPRGLLQPNNPYRAIRAVVRTESIRETESEAHNRGVTDIRRAAYNSNITDNLDGMAACAAARQVEVTENTSVSNCCPNEGRSLHGSQRDMIAVQVYRHGTNITFNVPRGTLVDDLTRSAEFITRVTSKWNITKCDLQNMVLRDHNQVIDTLETDCKIRLDRGHMDLFLN
ncbi:uncharacterized protein LOC110450981 [Mizuhopecten yessoensis]|uniref:uncharacterized protein LOC110450981 n=1 Tax=Mizuhopecten yessoensis TaxID=6573 RepID=UPI000B45EF39|nr:uncharacterized protein LOC110450981 [Mizuhopecten yessoensis]